MRLPIRGERLLLSSIVQGRSSAAGSPAPEPLSDLAALLRKEAVFFGRFGCTAIPREEMSASLEPKLCSYEAKLGTVVVMKCER